MRLATRRKLPVVFVPKLSGRVDPLLAFGGLVMIADRLTVAASSASAPA